MEQIGPYHVLAELGKGAMGTVYLCQDAEANELAVKVLHEDLVNDEADGFARFQREAAGLAALTGWPITRIKARMERAGQRF